LGASNNGSIRIRVKLTDGTNFDRTICVYIVDSSLILEWEKIDESSIREIKYSTSPDDSDTILVYPNTVSIYKVGGKNAPYITSVNWQATGGTVYNENSKSTPIMWHDEENSTLLIHLVMNDSVVERKINIVVMKQPGGDPGALNTLMFEYDSAGNQKKRGFIYLAKPPRNLNDNAKSKNLVVPKIGQFIQTPEYAELSYFPNPVSSELTIQWKQTSEKELISFELYNMSGQLLRTFLNKSDNNSFIIPFTGTQSGVYNLKLNYNNGEMKTLKIIKQ
jgi:hypothetical protein